MPLLDVFPVTLMRMLWHNSFLVGAGIPWLRSERSPLCSALKGLGLGFRSSVKGHENRRPSTALKPNWLSFAEGFGQQCEEHCSCHTGDFPVPLLKAKDLAGRKSNSSGAKGLTRIWVKKKCEKSAWAKRDASFKQAEKSLFLNTTGSPSANEFVLLQPDLLKHLCTCVL